MSGGIIPIAYAPPPTPADHARWKREEAEGKAWRRLCRADAGALVAPNVDTERDEPEELPAEQLPLPWE